MLKNCDKFIFFVSYFSLDICSQKSWNAWTKPELKSQRSNEQRIYKGKKQKKSKINTYKRNNVKARL